MTDPEFAAPLYERSEPPATDDLLDLARRCTAHDASEAGVRKLQGVIRRLVGRVEPPHPDTARADAAERMLASVCEWVQRPDTLTPKDTDALLAACPGLASWWREHTVHVYAARRIAALTAERERVEMELAAIACERCGGSREIAPSREPCSTETIPCPACDTPASASPAS